MIIVLVGKPGSGKTTAGRHLATGNYAHISSGDLARKMADKQDLGELASGEMFDEGRMRNSVNRAIYDALLDKKDVILDGFPRTVDQMHWLVQTFKSRYIMIHLDCNTDEIEKRLSLRHRADDNSVAIQKRVSKYIDFACDIADSGLLSDDVEVGKFKLITIDSSGTIQNTCNRILEEIECYTSQK